MDTVGLGGALLLFAASAVVVAIAGTRLAREGDVIAARTRLGGIWVGSIFLAIATSLPELMTSISAALLGAVDIAAGNLFGSSMANMLILALLTLLPAGVGLFSRAAFDQVLGASLAIVLNCLAGAFALARLPYAFAGVGAGSFILLVTYLLGTRTLYRHSALARDAVALTETEGGPAAVGGGAASAVGGRLATAVGEPVSAGAAVPPPERSLRRAVVGFVVASIVTMAAAPLFAGSAQRIAEITGLSETVVGTWLVGLATSLPEFATSLAAVRIGAFDLAVGNLFGSNAVNMLMFVPLDLAHGSAPVFSAIDPVHAISALFATAMMGMSLVALVSRVRRSFSMLEPSGLAMVAVYVLGMILLASRA
jgi:cation:H+ antiporter